MVTLPNHREKEQYRDLSKIDSRYLLPQMLHREVLIFQMLNSQYNLNHPKTQKITFIELEGLQEPENQEHASLFTIHLTLSFSGEFNSWLVLNLKRFKNRMVLSRIVNNKIDNKEIGEGKMIIKITIILSKIIKFIKMISNMIRNTLTMISNLMTMQVNINQAKKIKIKNLRSNLTCLNTVKVSTTIKKMEQT